MARGRIPRVEVEAPQPKPEPKPEVSLEERIREVAAEFRNERAQNVEREVRDMLEDGYESLIRREIGFERDSWGGLRLTHNSAASTEFRAFAQAAARRIVEGIDFGSVKLTPAQVATVRKAYQTELKRHVEDAARELAREHARNVAAQVLEILDEG